MRPSSISFVQRQLRDLAADPVERREHDRLRRVVDDEVDAGEVLERADVAALAADDAALHVVGREARRARPSSRPRGSRRRAAARRRRGCGRGASPRPAPPPRAWRTRRASSWRTSSSRALEQVRLRLVARSCPEIRSSSRQLARPSPAFSSSCSWRACASRSASPCSRRSSSTSFRSISSSLREHALLDLHDLRRAGPASSALDLGAEPAPPARAPRPAPRGAAPPPRAGRRRAAGARVRRAVRAAAPRGRAAREERAGDRSERRGR